MGNYWLSVSGVLGLAFGVVVHARGGSRAARADCGLRLHWADRLFVVIGLP